MWEEEDELASQRNSEIFRTQLQRLLISFDLSPLDLLRGWDQGNDGCFTRKEFLTASGTHLPYTAQQGVRTSLSPGRADE